MSDPHEQVDSHHRVLAWLVGVSLPLGPFGLFGIVGTAYFFLTQLREVRKFDVRLLLAPLPLAIVTVMTTLRTFPDELIITRVLGLALLYTPGLCIAARLVGGVRAWSAAAAFSSGAAVLGVTTVIDAVLFKDAIPAGLFTPHLHNWTAALLVLAFPLALHLLFSRQWCAGLLLLPPISSGVFFALSWSGALGLIIAAACYVVFRFPRLAVAVFLGSFVYISLTWYAGVFSQLGVVSEASRLLSEKLTRLGPLLADRYRIVTEGLAIATDRPWLGWGFDSTRQVLAERPLGAFYIDDLALAHFHNMFVQVFVETGLLGFTALGFLVGYLVTYQTGPFSSAVRAALIGFFVTQLFDVAWNQATIHLSVWYVASIGMRSYSLGVDELTPTFAHDT